MHLKSSHPALTENRTIHTKMVKDSNSVKNILKSVASNNKVGKKHKTVIKGPWSGMPMFSLTLEERKTCPTDCFRWSSCYGNGSVFAHRMKVDNSFYSKIYQELDTLNKKHTQGFIVRLHILGDFFSVEYVKFWSKMMRKFKNLYLFGYTSRLKGDIHNAIDLYLNRRFFSRCVIRYSVRREPTMEKDSGKRYAVGERSEGSVDCPEQTGKTDSCLTCGICFNPKITVPVYFADHDDLRKAKK